MIVRELLTRLGFDADNDGVKRHERALFSAKRAAAAFASSVVTVRGAMLLAARQTATAGVEVDRFARLSNATTNEFQRMAAGAETVGIESDKLSDILKDMNDRVGDFVQTGGGPLLDFFEQIGPKVGVTADSFKDLSGPEALQLYVSSLEKANLSQADMVFFMESIASDSTALLPILRNNGEAFADIADRAERFGAILSDDVIQAGKDFQRSFTGVRQIIQGLTYTVGERLLPSLNETLSGFIEWYDANQAIIRQGINRFFDEVSNIFDRAWRVGRKLVSVGISLSETFDTMEGSIIPLAAALFLMRGHLGAIMWVLKAGGLLLLLDDLSSWFVGDGSLIGDLIGPYEDFAAALGRLSEKLSELFQMVGVPEDMADSIGVLSIALGAFLGYRVAMIAFGTAATAMGGGLTALAVGLGSLAGSAAIKGVGILARVAGIATSTAGLAAIATFAPTQAGVGTLSEDPDQLKAMYDSLNVARPGYEPLAAPVVTNTINMELPPGSTQAQADYIKDQVTPFINRALNDAVGNAMQNYTRAE